MTTSQAPAGRKPILSFAKDPAELFQCLRPGGRVNVYGGITKNIDVKININFNFQRAKCEIHHYERLLINS